MSEADEVRPGGSGLQSLIRGLALIRAFDAEDTEMTLSEVARKADLTRATARRILLTLVDLGYVRTNGKVFSLTARILELGYSYLSGLSLPAIVHPILESLTLDVNEAASVSVLDGTETVYVARASTRRIVSIDISVGTRFPAHATSMGRVLLAALPPDELERRLNAMVLTARTIHTVASHAALREELAVVRAQGWSLVDQELEVGLMALAMPLTDASGRVIAAINVAGHAMVTTAGEFRDRVRGPLREAAAAANAELAMSRPIPLLMAPS